MIEIFFQKKPEAPKDTPKAFSAYLSKHFEKVKELENDLNRVPTKEESIFLISDGQWNAFTFIPFILKELHIKTIYISTYSIAQRTVEALVQLYDESKIDEIHLLISDSLKKRNPVTIDKIESMASTRAGFTVKYAWNHSKITLIECAEDYFVVEGSGNFADNAHYEQYAFVNSKSLFDFRKEFFENVITK